MTENQSSSNNNFNKSNGIEPKPLENKKVKKTIFVKKDYISFMLGVFILGGIIALPLVWNLFLGISYLNLLPLSLLLCVCLLITFRRNGTISWFRAIPAWAIFGTVVGTVLQEFSSKHVPPLSKVLIGILILIICGRVGIKAVGLFHNKSTTRLPWGRALGT